MTQPLIKQIWVHTTPDRAFELFTTHVTEWWPLETHSVGEKDAVSVAIELGMGGQIVEKIKDGSTSVWGTITKWDPPSLLAFTWHPGQEAGEATNVEVSFTADGGRTMVELIHSGWELWPEGRAGYDTGWDYVLGQYEHLARKPA